MSANIEKLPNEALSKICEYFCYSDLISCCHACRRLRDAASDDLLWKRQCRRYWLVTQCPDTITWKENFAVFFKDYGRYINIYARVRKAWDQIEDFTEEHVPRIFESLQDGLSEEELDTVERRLELPLPDSLRCVYRLHNGQQMNHDVGLGLLGSTMVYNRYTTLLLIDLKMANMHTLSMRNLFRSPNGETPLASKIPIAHCFHYDLTNYVTLSEAEGHQREQVLCPARARHLDSKPFDDSINFIVGNNFLDWFTSYAEELAGHRYPVGNHTFGTEILNFLDDPTCEAWTGNICVKVSTRFCPEESTVEPPSFFHIYRIQMSMPADAPKWESCRLQTRHWVITDEEGGEERVDGPGVIGEHPMMWPGAEFAYCSCTSFSTTYGNMSGHFIFQRLSTGEEVRVKVPTFHMKCLPYETRHDCQQRLLMRKKAL